MLFLDDLPEFGRQVLGVTRQPLEDGSVSLGRARGTIAFPAEFMLVGAMDFCPFDPDAGRHLPGQARTRG